MNLIGARWGVEEPRSLRRLSTLSYSTSASPPRLARHGPLTLIHGKEEGCPGVPLGIGCGPFQESSCSMIHDRFDS